MMDELRRLKQRIENGEAIRIVVGEVRASEVTLSPDYEKYLRKLLIVDCDREIARLSAPEIIPPDPPATPAGAMPLPEEKVS